ncbi:twin-arginine translocation signal domain-containing protein [Sphingomonas naphthae]|uniref:Twin-arginine translocation signal domain-containing protein n=1 Tax=Sphingomonas naphthae TaxID=1813468 RepID=A0ABY7TL88_9SPHN|nr:twin-arginine translocation signal domain-containing protein [Sphingomonas naphthae]WCT73798.1 twin-arginine translocation signal domain-containing protein [Sphingomonas naphthae]
MATAARSIVPACIAPGKNADKSTAPSRRGFLALAAAVPAAGAMAGLPATVRPSPWNRAVAALQAAKTAREAYERDVFLPMDREYNRRSGKRPSLDFSVKALNGHVATYHMRPHELDDWADCDMWRRYAAPIREEYRAWQRRHDAALRDLNYEAIQVRYDDLNVVEADAEDALIATPAPDGAALAAKVRLVLSLTADSSFDDRWRQGLLADCESFEEARSKSA